MATTNNSAAAVSGNFANGLLSHLNVSIKHNCKIEIDSNDQPSVDESSIEQTSQDFGDIKCTLTGVSRRDKFAFYCKFDSVHPVQYWYCIIESSSMHVIPENPARPAHVWEPILGFYDTISNEKLVFERNGNSAREFHASVEFTARGVCFPTKSAAVDFSNAKTLFSDLVLQFNGNKHLHVHRSTLSQVSTVFHDMFAELGTQENTDNDGRTVIEMPDDVDYDSFVRMLYHIYPQSLMPLHSAHFEDTLAMADRFNVAVLLGKCDQFLVSSENAMPLHARLLQADRYGRSQVLDWCLDKLDQSTYPQLRANIDMRALSKSTIIKLLTKCEAITGIRDENNSISVQAATNEALNGQENN